MAHRRHAVSRRFRQELPRIGQLGLGVSQRSAGIAYHFVASVAADLYLAANNVHGRQGLTRIMRTDFIRMRTDSISMYRKLGGLADEWVRTRQRPDVKPESNP